MSGHDRTLKVLPGVTDARQFRIYNAVPIPAGQSDEVYDREYVGFSGYFGPHNPNTFAAAPELLQACKAIMAVNEGVEPAATAGDRVAMWASAFAQISAAVAKATGEAK